MRWSPCGRFQWMFIAPVPCCTIIDMPASPSKPCRSPLSAWPRREAKNQFYPISKNSQHSKTRGTRHGAVVSTVEARGMSTPSVSEIVPARTSDGGDVAPKSKGKPPKGPGGGRGGRGRGRGRAGALGKEKARDLTSPLRMITKHSTQIH